MVPAAGSSTRFGTMKLLADVGGAPLLERTLGSLLDAGVARVVVVTRTGDAFGAVPSMHDPKVAAVAQGRSLRLPTELDDDVVASEQKLADLFAESKQIPAAPKLADWVDKRYNDALRPLLISTN